MKKILLVDDEPISNFILKRMISFVSPDFEVYDFTDAAKAINQIEVLQPDLIFLDLNMPLIDGWKFLDMMNDMNNSTDVFVLTSSTSAIDKDKSLHYSNVIGFLIKPLPADVLKNLLTTTLAESDMMV